MAAILRCAIFASSKSELMIEHRAKVLPSGGISLHTAILFAFLPERQRQRVVHVRIAGIIPERLLAMLNRRVELRNPPLAVAKAEICQTPQFLPNICQVRALLASQPQRYSRARNNSLCPPACCRNRSA